MEHMIYDEGSVLVRRMPGDGHCLFSALVYQQFNSEVGSAEHYEKVMNLRRRVVDHIRNNMDNFRASLADTVEEMRHLGHASVEDKMEEFLQRIAESNEWGGQETIAAAAFIFNKRIDVYYEQGPLIVFNRELAVFGVLRVAYRLAARISRNTHRNHYDSVVQRLSVNRDIRERSNNPTDGITSNLHPPLERVTELQLNCMPNCSHLSANPLVQYSGYSNNETDNTKFSMLSWNVRGCSEEQKRKDIDKYFAECGYSIIALQETRLAECSIETNNYFWFNVNVEHNGRDRIGGGTALLVAKGSYQSGRFKKISANSCAYLGEIFDTKVIIISTYIRAGSDGDCSEFGSLSRYILGLTESMKGKIIIMGDLNARIGISEISEDDRRIIGKSLFHDSSNSNGFELKNFMHGVRLKNYLTISKSKSVLWTWTNGKCQSQLDHILMSKMDFLKIPIIRAYYHNAIRSDHKMVACILSKRDNDTETPENYSNILPAAKKVKYDLEKLKKGRKRTSTIPGNNRQKS